MFNFLPLINSSVTVELSFLLLRISAIMSSNTINIFCFLSGLYSSTFFSYIVWLFNKAFGSLKCLEPVLSHVLINNWYFAS